METIEKQRFGRFVAQLRKEKGWTQKELAERLCLSDKAVSKWETGASLPDTAMLLPLSEILGVTVTELLLCRRQDPDHTMEQMDVEQVVQTAVLYGEDRPRRAWQETGLWRWVYLLALLVGAASMWLCYRNGIRMDALWAPVMLGAIFGAYFCFYARLQLPERYDRERINLVYDGFFRMHMVGIAFNNRNWPHIINVGRIWSCAVMALLPLLAMGLAAVDADLWFWLQLPVVLIVSLGGLFVPLWVVARRYQS